MDAVSVGAPQWSWNTPVTVSGSSVPTAETGLGIDLMELTVARPQPQASTPWWSTLKQDLADWWQLTLKPLIRPVWSFAVPDVSLSQSGKTYVPLIAATANRHGIPPAILLALVERESGGNPRAVGDNGQSIGLGQIYKPAHPRFYAEHDPYDPAQNIEYSATLLKSLYRRFGQWEAALAAYNAGSGAVERALAKGQSPDSVTHQGRYASRVLATAARFGYQTV